MAKGRRTAALAGLATGLSMDDNEKRQTLKNLGSAADLGISAATDFVKNPAKFISEVGEPVKKLSREETQAYYDSKKSGMKKGGMVKKMAKGGSASSRGDGCAQRGKTRGKFV
jgi:hypothetical protein